jgi:DegV family protein with EDD domain
LYASEIKENELYFLPLTYSIEDKSGVTEYQDNFQSMDEYVAYYNRLREGVMSRTSMNNPAVHEEHFRKMAEAGVKDAIHFTISYGLCRTVEVAREAVEQVKKDFPDFNCLCVECNTTTVGQGFLVKIAIDMRNRGKTLQETFDYVEANKSKIQHFIIVDSLTHLMRGGRLSATSAIVGTMLKVKPILVFNKEGKLQKYKQSTGMKHTIATAVKEAEKYTINKDYPLFTVAHTDNLAMAELLSNSLKSAYRVNTETRMIGPVIGSHLGPNAVAYIFLSNEERPL